MLKSVKLVVSLPVPVSIEDGIVALVKAHTHSGPPLSSLPMVALKAVSVFIWLSTDRSRALRLPCQVTGDTVLMLELVGEVATSCTYLLMPIAPGGA